MTNKRMPGILWGVLVVLVLQAAANGFTGFLLQDEIGDRLDHGQEVANSGLVHGMLYISYAVAAVLLASVVFLAMRRPWAQYPVYVIEALSILSGLVLLVVGGDVAAVSGLAMAVGVLVGLTRPEVSEWLDPEFDEAPPPANWPHTAA